MNCVQHAVLITIGRIVPLLARLLVPVCNPVCRWPELTTSGLYQARHAQISTKTVCISFLDQHMHLIVDLG